MRAVRRFGADDVDLLRWLGTALWLLVCVMLISSVAIWASRGAPWQTVGLRQGVLSLSAVVLTGLVYGSVGAFLVRRAPRNPIGWLFIAIAVGMALLLPVNLWLESTVHAFRPIPPLQLWLAWALTTVQLPLSGAAIIAAILLFPTGRPAWPRTRTTMWLALGGALLLALSATLRPDGLLWYTTLPNPAAVPATLRPVITLAALVGLVALVSALAASAGSLAWRHQHGDARERRQLAWVMVGSAAMAGAVAVLFVVRYVGAASAADGDILLFTGAVGAVLLPLSMVRFTTVTESHGRTMSDLTFLFTDLQDSTAMYERVGDVMAFDLVRLHFDTLEATTRRHGGAIVKTIGDAIMARFLDPADGVRTALEMFERLDRFNRRSDTHLILKVGLHRGDAIVVSSRGRVDYFGQTVNIASRVGAVAGAGEIVLTEQVYRGTGVAQSLEGLPMRHTHAELKGVASEVGIYRVTAAEMDGDGVGHAPAGARATTDSAAGDVRSTPTP